MSLEIDQIKELFGSFAEKYGPKVIVPATVTAVNNDDTVSVVFSDGATVNDARLKSVVKEGNKVILIPVVNSIVDVAKIENSDEYLVIAVSEVSEIKIMIDGISYSINSDGFLIQKDNDTLKDALVTFVEAVETIVVMQGRNPDRIKLAAAKTKLQNILR